MTVHTVNRIVINADPDLVFQIASDVERWPTFLTHYRGVRILQAGPPRQVYMAASRSGLPVSWTSTQTLLVGERRILYHHLQGVTRGMDVEWRITPNGGGCEVLIDHVLLNGRIWLRWPLAEYLVGRVFVMHIADRTLAGVKARAEGTAQDRP